MTCLARHGEGRVSIILVQYSSHHSKYVGRQEHTWAEYDPRRTFRLSAALEICHEEHGVIAGRKPGRMQVPG
jgi:hypothetical protein